MIKHIQDTNVDAELDKKIIQLLSMCFVKEPVLQQQRFVKEMPQHRWYIEDENKMIAHVALHEKNMSTKNAEFPFGGIAEVAVHQDFRGRGYIKKILIQIHNWLKTNKYPFVILFGETEIYASSGYSPVQNEIKYFKNETNKWTIEINRHALKSVLGSNPWPEGMIDIKGPMF
jgi:predicted acetyltransferase